MLSDIRYADIQVPFLVFTFLIYSPPNSRITDGVFAHYSIFQPKYIVHTPDRNRRQYRFMMTLFSFIIIFLKHRSTFAWIFLPDKCRDAVDSICTKEDTNSVNKSYKGIVSPVIRPTLVFQSQSLMFKLYLVVLCGAPSICSIETANAFLTWHSALISTA